MIAVIPVRSGTLPTGADEAIAEAGGRALVVGSGTGDVLVDGVAAEVLLAELGAFRVAGWIPTLSRVISGLDDADVVVLPSSPDGRDLAPGLARSLGRPLFAGATRIDPTGVDVARRGGRELHRFRPSGPFVATLQPGVRGAEPFAAPPSVGALDPGPLPVEHETHDASVLAVLDADASTMDLTEAARIVGGGAGLDDPDRFRQLDVIARSIAAVVGATRVVTDRGWVPHERQIGTTGAVVDPRLYVAFGISGAVQHTSGLGDPEHVISVNTDPHCPMMQLADLAVVSDANAVLDELERLLATSEGTLGESA